MARTSQSYAQPSRRRSSQAKTVLVTGGSGGIGRAICRAFGQAEWRVGVHYRERKAEAQETLDLVRAGGGTGAIFQADVRCADEVAGIVDSFCRDHERLDAMICNAGMAAGTLVLRQSVEAWNDIVATNLTGVFHCLQAVGRRMVKQKSGSIIVVGSYASVQGSAGQAAYTTSKAGLLGLVKTAAREWGLANVRVNLIFPGWHRTDLAGDSLPDGEALDDHCLGRSPNLDEVARTVLYLAQLNDVSGQVWNLDSRIL